MTPYDPRGTKPPPSMKIPHRLCFKVSHKPPEQMEISASEMEAPKVG